jgi:hypothetical protein
LGVLDINLPATSIPKVLLDQVGKITCTHQEMLESLAAKLKYKELQEWYASNRRHRLGNVVDDSSQALASSPHEK